MKRIKFLFAALALLSGVIACTKTEETTTPAGIVFLPAAGFRNGNGVTHVDSYAYYWSSNADSNIYRACRLFFSGLSIKPVSVDGRYIGFSVRLVTECQ